MRLRVLFLTLLSLLHWMRINVFSFLFTCCCAQSFCWMRPSWLTWLCTSLSAGFASVWWSFLALFHSRASSTKGAVSSAASPWSLFHALFLHPKLAGSRSASLHLATEPLSARGRASECSGPCCESESGSPALSVHVDHLLQTL